MPSPAVDIRNVTHRYGDHVAVRDVSFEVERGMLFGLLGPNGGGKTTLFRILSTLIHPSQGRAAVFGHDTVAGSDAVRRRLGVVFQKVALDAELTVRESLHFHGALHGLGGTAFSRRVDVLVDTFGLSDRVGDRVRTLSGGLQRRVDLVRGLLHAPPLLLLDEPTTGLDPAARRTFWEALARLRRSEGTTLLVATHLMEEAEQCDAVGIMDRGRLVAHDAPEALTRALGDETLWLEADDPAELRDRIQAQFGLTAEVTGGRVQIVDEGAPAHLTALYDAFGDRITSATVRKPTLEDVFLVHTGHALDERNAVLEGSTGRPLP